MVGAGEESGRHQRGSVVLHGKFSDNEAVSTPYLSAKVRPLGVLQRGHSGYTKVPDGVDAELGSLQGHTEASGMKHDRDNNDDA